MDNRKIFLFIFALLLINLVSAQYYYDSFTPSDFLENEWFVFVAIFALVFSLTFIALNKQFSTSSSGKNDLSALFAGKSKTNENKGAVVIISLVIAFFSASIFVQQGWIYGIFGDALVSWLFLLAMIVMVILGIPFFKALKANVGTGLAIVLTFLFIWVILRFFVDPYSFPGLPYEAYITLEFLGSFLALGIAIVIGVLALLIKNSGR